MAMCIHVQTTIHTYTIPYTWTCVLFTLHCKVTYKHNRFENENVLSIVYIYRYIGNWNTVANGHFGFQCLVFVSVCRFFSFFSEFIFIRWPLCITDLPYCYWPGFCELYTSKNLSLSHSLGQKNLSLSLFGSKESLCVQLFILKHTQLEKWIWIIYSNILDILIDEQKKKKNIWNKKR